MTVHQNEYTRRASKLACFVGDFGQPPPSRAPQQRRASKLSLFVDDFERDVAAAPEAATVVEEDGDDDENGTRGGGAGECEVELGEIPDRRASVELYEMPDHRPSATSATDGDIDALAPAPALAARASVHRAPVFDHA